LLSAECTCPVGATPCTDLLYQASRVLRNRQLWPVNLCDDAFLRESTRIWFSRTALLTGSLGHLDNGSATWALERMTDTWPLPIGREAINLRGAMFEGDTAAYMASVRMASSLDRYSHVLPGMGHQTAAAMEAALS
jgi:hypothetical protein